MTLRSLVVAGERARPARRRRELWAVTRLATLLAALAPLTFAAPPASAGLLAPCEAYAYAPTWDNFYSARAFGGFRCDTPRATVSVVVCMEALSSASLWEELDCWAEADHDVPEVSAAVDTCRDGITLIRSTASGWASTGETGSAVSGPVPYVCTPR